MATYAKLLKNSNGDNILPYTRDNYVYHGDSSTVTVNSYLASFGTVYYYGYYTPTTINPGNLTWHQFDVPAGTYACFASAQAVDSVNGRADIYISTTPGDGAGGQSSFPYSQSYPSCTAGGILVLYSSGTIYLTSFTSVAYVLNGYQFRVVRLLA